MSTAIPNGVYYISCQLTDTVFTLTDGDEGTNLTAWDLYGGPEQQWNVNHVNEQYAFQNVKYGNYISFANREASKDPYTALYANATSFRFIIEEYKGGFLIATQSAGANVVNLAGASFANDSFVIFWPLEVHTGPDNAVWYFNSTTGSTTGQTSAPSTSAGATLSTPSDDTHHSSLAGPIAGGVIGGILIMIGLLSLAFYLGRSDRFRRGTPNLIPFPATSQLHSTYQTLAMPVADNRGPAMSLINPNVSSPDVENSAPIVNSPIPPYHKPRTLHVASGVRSPDGLTSSTFWDATTTTGHQESGQTTSPISPNPAFVSMARSRVTDSIIVERDPPPLYN